RAGFSPANRRSVSLYGERPFGFSRQRVAVAGVNSVTAAFSVSLLIWRRAFTSSTHTLRPWVATTISSAVVGWANSWHATVGSPPPSLAQLPPLFSDTNAPNSVPQYRTLVLL